MTSKRFQHQVIERKPKHPARFPDKPRSGPQEREEEPEEKQEHRRPQTVSLWKRLFGK